MSEPKKTDFRPKWQMELSPEEEKEFDKMDFTTGSDPDEYIHMPFPQSKKVCRFVYKGKGKPLPVPEELDKISQLEERIRELNKIVIEMSSILDNQYFTDEHLDNVAKLVKKAEELVKMD
jgi:hypothetical protein